MPARSITVDYWSAVGPILKFLPRHRSLIPAVHNQAYVSLTIHSHSPPTASFPSPALTVPKNALARPINFANSLLMGSQ